MINSFLQQQIDCFILPQNTSVARTMHAIQGEKGWWCLVGALLKQIADNGSTTPQGGEHTIVSSDEITGGTVTSGATSVVFLPSSDFNGSIDNVSYDGGSWQVIPFQAQQGWTLPAIDYTRTTGQVKIIRIYA